VTLAGWTPTGLTWRDGRPRVELRDLRGLALDAPFFEQTLERAMREPYRLLFAAEAGLADLPEADGPSPDGLILHGSRCGSTLLAALLGDLDGAAVVSEPPVVDQVLRAPLPAAERAEALRRILAALTPPAATRRFLKLDSWSVHDLATIRAAFPASPWVFVYREPGQVLRSQLRLRGMQMVPGVIDPAHLGLDPRELATPAPADYCARVLAAMYDAAADGLDARGRLVTYADLPEPGTGDVLAHFGITPAPHERERMAETVRYEAKNPALFFDRERPPVPPDARAAAERIVAGPYRRLERLRAAQGPAGPC
jgi:hypothetical protein